MFTYTNTESTVTDTLNLCLINEKKKNKTNILKLRVKTFLGFKQKKPLHKIISGCFCVFHAKCIGSAKLELPRFPWKTLRSLSHLRHQVITTNLFPHWKTPLALKRMIALRENKVLGEKHFLFSWKWEHSLLAHGECRAPLHAPTPARERMLL